MKALNIKINENKKKDLDIALATIAPYMGRRGQLTDFVRPAIEKFIEATRQDRGIEFIEHIKSWR